MTDRARAAHGAVGGEDGTSGDVADLGGPGGRPVPRCALCGRRRGKLRSHARRRRGAPLLRLARALPWRCWTRCPTTRRSSCATAGPRSRRPTRTPRSPRSSGHSMPCSAPCDCPSTRRSRTCEGGKRRGRLLEALREGGEHARVVSSDQTVERVRGSSPRRKQRSASGSGCRAVLSRCSFRYTRCARTVPGRWLVRRCSTSPRWRGSSAVRLGSDALLALPASFVQPVDAEGEREQHRRRDRVEPVVVRRQHDRGERDHRVEDHEVAPPAARRQQHRPRDDQRPPEVQRRHRRELVGEALVRTAPAVRRRSEHLGGVDEAEVAGTCAGERAA